MPNEDTEEEVENTSDTTEVTTATEKASVTTASESSGAMNYTISESGPAYTLDAEQLLDADTLKDTLADIKSSGYSAVVFPVKVAGGTFYYSTQIEMALLCYEGDPAIASDITAEELVEMAESVGLRAVASISVLNDNNRYGDYRFGAYRSTDGSVWLDASADNGGKPWLSPFDSSAQEFCCDIVRELANAGFSEIICYDFIFPEFRTSDIELISDDVSVYGDRYKALTNLAVMMTNAGAECGAQVMLKVTANSIIKSYSELYVPSLLEGCMLIIDYSENNISTTMVSDGTELILSEMSISDKIATVYSYISTQAESYGITTVPMVDSGSMTADEWSDAVKALLALGYDKYYVY